MTGKTWYEIKAKGPSLAEVYIYDEIGAFGVSAKSFADDLKAYPNARQIQLRINSPGGSVFDGNAIYNQLKQHPAKITAHIDGLAASMASVIAMAADHIVMPENALMMIHNPWTMAVGDAEQLRKDADVLDKVKTTLIGAYGRSSMSEEEITAIMDAETWLTAEQALEMGFADEIQEEMQMAASANFPLLNKFEKTPELIKDGQLVTAKARAEMQELIDFNTSPFCHNEKMARIFEGKTPQDFIKDGITTPDALREHLLNELGKDQKPSSHGAIVMDQKEYIENFKKDASDALLMRANIPVKNASSGARELAGLSLMDMAKKSVELTGRSTMMMSKQEILGAAFSHSTSDFTHLLGNTARKALSGAYEESVESHIVWTPEREVPDFKPQSLVKLSEAPDLQKVAEGAEYKQGSFSDDGQDFHIEKFGRIFNLTYESVVNDDLDAFTRLPRAFAIAARRLECDMVYKTLTDNPKVSDGKALFHADHNNIATAAGLSVTSLAAARTMMRKQRGLSSKAPLNLQPRFLIVPAALEGQAEQLLASVVDPTKSNDTPNLNFIRNMELVVDSRLDEKSEQEWYVAASPTQVDTITRLYLAGAARPYLEERQGWEIDGMSIKCRLEFASVPLDFRGLVKNPAA